MRLTIYLVEDDTDIREMERYALENSGYDVSEFGDGTEFLAALERSLPDLVLLDIMLPGLDGLSVLQKIRSSEKTRQLPR